MMNIIVFLKKVGCLKLYWVYEIDWYYIMFLFEYFFRKIIICLIFIYVEYLKKYLKNER